MRILHTADNHLGVRQYGLLERQSDFSNAVFQAAELAKLHRVDVMTFGGDQFHSTHPPAQAVADLRAAVRASGKPCYGIDGNHDVSGSQWLKLCDICPLETWYDDGRPLLQDIDGVTMFGLNSYVPSVFRQKLKQLADGLGGTKLDVLLVHMPLSDIWNKGGGLDKTAATAQEIAEALADKGLRLVLLGDIHDYAETVVGGVRFVYPGSTEITASDEQRDKGVLLVEITREDLKMQRLSINTRPFLDIHIDSEEKLEELLATIETQKTDRDPIALITYDKAVKGALARISGIIGDKYMFRAMPARSGVAASLDMSSVPELATSFDRDAAVKALKEVLLGDFPEGSDAPALIIEMLDNPDKVVKLAEAYVKDKGVELRV